MPPCEAPLAAASPFRCRWLEPRFHIVLACFLATVTIYVERVGFSIAFTAMASKVTRADLRRPSGVGPADGGPAGFEARLSL